MHTMNQEEFDKAEMLVTMWEEAVSGLSLLDTQVVPTLELRKQLLETIREQAINIFKQGLTAVGVEKYYDVPDPAGEIADDFWRDCVKKGDLDVNELRRRLRATVAMKFAFVPDRDEARRRRVEAAVERNKRLG